MKLWPWNGWRGEIDLDKAEWRIPAERVKTRVEHVVPLALQAARRGRQAPPAVHNISSYTGIVC